MVWEEFGSKPKKTILMVLVLLHIFGFLKRTKLDSKSQKFMLKGYSDNHKVNRLIGVETDCLRYNMDVIVNEGLETF